MEIFELRYFLGVARDENLHRASEKLRVSPASLSKAVSRLEDELGTKLFRREGRRIQLTDQGRLLQRKASEIVQLEEAARVEVAGHRGQLQAVVAGPEVLLTRMGLDLARRVRKRHPAARFEFRAVTESAALEQVARGETHLAIVTSDPPAALTARTLEEARFQAYVGETHALAKAAQGKRVVPVEEVLEYPFVSPSHPLLGKVGVKQSLDGWRDDRFPRRVDYLTSSLKLLEELVVSGQAVAYLPDYFGEKLAVRALRISGCPYTCVQKVRLVARKPEDIGWIHQLF